MTNWPNGWRSSTSLPAVFLPTLTAKGWGVDRMPTIADAAAQVLAAGVPVLFLDTCSILDVIRAPARGLANCVEAATELLGMATGSPPSCSLVIGSFVP